MPARRHGQSGTPIYKVWVAMLQRCVNPNDPAYSDYGARGITVCERWKVFDNFFEDMGEAYRRGLTLERHDNDAGYGPGNCTWEDRVIQANNRQHTLRWEHNGTMKTLRELMEHCVVDMPTLKQRLLANWDVETALTQPSQRTKVYDNSIHGNKGSEHGMSKLTETIVRNIRELARQHVPNRHIARIYNLTPSNVGYIVKRKTWTHI